MLRSKLPPAQGILASRPGFVQPYGFLSGIETYRIELLSLLCFQAAFLWFILSPGTAASTRAFPHPLLQSHSGRNVVSKQGPSMASAYHPCQGNVVGSDRSGRWGRQKVKKPLVVIAGVHKKLEELLRSLRPKADAESRNHWRENHDLDGQKVSWLGKDAWGAADGTGEWAWSCTEVLEENKWE